MIMSADWAAFTAYLPRFLETTLEFYMKALIVILNITDLIKVYLIQIK